MSEGEKVCAAGPIFFQVWYGTPYHTVWYCCSMVQPSVPTKMYGTTLGTISLTLTKLIQLESSTTEGQDPEAGLSQDPIPFLCGSHTIPYHTPVTAILY